MHPNAILVQRFYACFASRDVEGMIACYHPRVTFRDPAFGDLSAAEAAAMWRMLISRGKDLVVVASGIEADDGIGSARWVATYSFGKAKRRVHNVIDARFRFEDGLIVRHEDSFDLWRWASMALGPMGRLLGWTPLVQRRIRREARRGIEKFIEAGAGPRSRAKSEG